MKYIASCSFGKDSLAMVLLLIEKGYPLDEVIFYDTGMEFQAIYDIRDRVVPMLEAHGIKYTELKPKKSFLYYMFDTPHTSRKDGITRYGYGWCGGICRWGTQYKVAALNEYYKQQTDEIKEYVGIAFDEPHRFERAKEKGQILPLVEWKKREADCLQYCYSKGFYWEEKTPVTKSGYIRLYDILDRVSCWCCCNKNKKELQNIHKYLPQYWERLKGLQRKIVRPMKKFCNKKYGHYGNVFDMEKVFEQEQIECSKCEQITIFDMDK